MPRRSAHRLIVLVLLLTSTLVIPQATATAKAAQVSGFIDAHSHLFSYEAFGGRLMCGKPFDPDGIATALTDCPDHYPNGELAWFENFTRKGTVTGTHDPSAGPRSGTGRRTTR